MNDATLDAFRKIADDMLAARGETADWQWIGPHMSQRMYWITQARAEAHAARHGGTAEPVRHAIPALEADLAAAKLIDPD